MTAAQARQPSPLDPSVQEVLTLLAERLRSSTNAVRAIALAPLPDGPLRQDILSNPRLAARIEARVCGTEGWLLPDYLDSFPQAPLLVELLRDGPERTFRPIGFAWHANTVARMALSDGKALAERLPRDALKTVLLLRPHASADVDAALPDDAALERAGELCLWAWVSALPERIRILCMAVLLRDTFAHGALAGLSDTEKTQRSKLAEAWLQTSIAAGEVAP